MSISML